MTYKWDDRHGVVVHQWSSLSSVIVQSATTRAGDSSRHIVSAAGTNEDFFDIDSLYVQGSSDVLIVAFHGALVRGSVELPRFEWLGALSSRKDHLLFVADTALGHSDLLTLGWYIGNAHDDLAVKIASYIKHVAKQTQVKKIILLGSSGGGYAALSIATYIENSNVVAFTPQTNVWDFTPGHTKNLLSESFSGFEGQFQVNALDPNRFSLIERYKNAERLNRFIYVQNLGDDDHLIKHFKPFSNSLGVRLKNGKTFDQKGRFISFFHGKGHVAPPKDRLHEFIDLAISDLDEPFKTPLKSSHSFGNLNDYTFNEGGTSFVDVTPELNSYHLVSDIALAPESPNLAYTADGVPLRVLDGKQHNHPVLQAQFMLKHINSLRRHGSWEYSSALHATAKRLMDYAVESRDALFMPFGFPWNAGKQQPPWYSAMAQGQVLSAISRLHELEPRAEYVSFAHKLFASFELLPVDATSSVPWIVDIDSEGYLWLDEYPYPGQGKCVLNGHLFSAWGLYDYWRVFGNERALTIANAALETTKRYMPESRNVGWSSHYDLTKFFLIRNYHQTHIWQMETTYNLTGDPFFLQMADLLESDFPSYQRNGSVYLAAGEHEIHTMDNIAVPTLSLSSETVVLEAAISFNFAIRTKVESLDGIWLRIEGGQFDSMWVREQPSKAFPRLCLDKHFYARPRVVLFSPGEYEHHTFNEWGSIIDKIPFSIAENTLAVIRSKALWNGIWYYEFAEQTALNSSFKPGRWFSVATPGSYSS